MNDAPSIIDINHLHGQVAAQRALLLGLANLLLDRSTFREEGLKRLEALRIAFLASHCPDATRDGIDAVEQWLLTVTSPD